LIPKRIKIENDLIISPSALIRISEETQTKDEVFSILIVNNGIRIYEGTFKDKGAFLLGIFQKVPNELMERWQLELKARADIDEKTYYRELKLWSIDTIFIHCDLHPNDILNIKVLNSKKIAWIDRNYHVGYDFFQDFLICFTKLTNQKRLCLIINK